MSAAPQEDSLTAAIVPAAALDDRLLDEWDRLADRLSAAPFVRPGFLMLWQRWFGHGELILATVRRDGELVGALPVARSKHRVLRYPANWHTPMASILATGREACVALAGLLARAGGSRVAIPLLDETDARLEDLADGMRERHYRITRRTLGRSPYRDLDGDWKAFEAAMNAKARRDIRRRRRRLEEVGAVSVEHVTSATELDQRLEEAYEVESSGWKDRRGTAIHAGVATEGFYTDLAHWAAERGWLRLTFLRLDGRALAVSYALWANAVHYGLKTGYDTDFARYAPGMLVVHEEIRAAFAAGMERMEMLGEDDEYKRVWCDAARERVGLQAFAPSLGGMVSWMAFEHLRPIAVKLGARRIARAVGSEGPRL